MVRHGRSRAGGCLRNPHGGPFRPRSASPGNQMKRSQSAITGTTSSMKSCRGTSCRRRRKAAFPCPSCRASSMSFRTRSRTPSSSAGGTRGAAGRVSGRAGPEHYQGPSKPAAAGTARAGLTLRADQRSRSRSRLRVRRGGHRSAILRSAILRLWPPPPSSESAAGRAYRVYRQSRCGDAGFLEPLLKSCRDAACRSNAGSPAFRFAYVRRSVANISRRWFA
jgi:hypothetical protein